MTRDPNTLLTAQRELLVYMNEAGDLVIEHPWESEACEQASVVIGRNNIEAVIDRIRALTVDAAL